MSNRALKRRIASLQQRIAKHEAKIAAEKTLSCPDSGLIIHWSVEIEAFEVSLQRALKRLADSVKSSMKDGDVEKENARK